MRNSRRRRRKERRGANKMAEVECARDGDEEAIVAGGRWTRDILAGSPVGDPSVDSRSGEKEEGTPHGVMDATHQTSEELHHHLTASISPATTTSSVGFMLVDAGPLTVACG